MVRRRLIILHQNISIYQMHWGTRTYQNLKSPTGSHSVGFSRSPCTWSSEFPYTIQSKIKSLSFFSDTHLKPDICNIGFPYHSSLNPPQWFVVTYMCLEPQIKAVLHLFTSLRVVIWIYEKSLFLKKEKNGLEKGWFLPCRMCQSFLGRFLGDHIRLIFGAGNYF